MPLPRLHYAKPNGRKPDFVAQKLFENIEWVDRLTAEMTVEPKLNLQKLWQFLEAARAVVALSGDFKDKGDYTLVTAALARLYTENSSAKLNEAMTNEGLKELVATLEIFLANVSMPQETILTVDTAGRPTAIEVDLDPLIASHIATVAAVMV